MIEDHSVCRRSAERLYKRTPRPVTISLSSKQDAQRIQISRMLRFVAHCDAKVLHCLGVIRRSAMFCKQASNGIAAVDISRIDSNDSLMSGDCFLNAVRLLLNMSKQTQKSGIGGIARNPLFEQKLRLE